MKTNRIELHPDRLNVPLAEVFAGRLSSAVWEICGDVPDDVESMSVQVGRTPDPATHQPRQNFVVACNRNADGTFRCYLSPFCFPDASEELEYHVVATDSNGNARWLGTGSLVVRDNPAEGSPVPPEVIPADTYVRNPVTGLYHKLAAEVNEFDEVTITVDPEGIAR